ncbi:ribonuclease-like protein P complex subunit Pop4 [Zopfia rhizophila CBS 207.26]|uniref:Ribonuclease P protein subunit n=1 Tax=Zopfia rhizophila CBS 207.26 TaxID=1314779 RepID=A0A6A6E8M3_9PEZI|nr:ribonuclease-like protein P complex subunit Pop4 [Zopfia rhizophila CBS 207.26]
MTSTLRNPRTSTPSTTNHFAHTLLERAHSPETAERIFAERAVQRPLLLRPSSPQLSQRALRRKAYAQRKEIAKKRDKLKPRPLSAAQKRKLGLFEIPEWQRKYAIYEPLHNLWLGYMREILGLSDGNEDAGAVKRMNVSAVGAGSMIATADMHGAILEVVRSRCVSRLGVNGIVVRDSKFVFEVITKGDAIKTIPKEHTTFRFEIPFPSQEGVETPKPLIFEIIGKQFQNRAPDRAKKNYKMHYQPDY